MFRRVLLLALLTLLALGTASAQTTGSIRGQVLDSTGAGVPNASITFSSPALQGTKPVTADAAGYYSVMALPTGIYTLETSLKGFATAKQENVFLRAGQTLSIDITLKVGAVASTVDVTAKAEETPIVDTSTQTQRYNVSGEFMRNLPLGARQEWENVWWLVPGVVMTADEKVDPEVHGADSRSNIYKMDGFEIGNSFTNQGWTTQFSTEAIQDVNIVTSGPDASQPLGTGGFINVVTKSGGNKYHGSAAFYLQPTAWNWANIAGGTAKTQNLYQPDFSFGGPIRKDSTWFFATYRRQILNQGIARQALTIQTFQKYNIPIPDYKYGERNDRINVKATQKLWKNQTLTAMFWDDRGVTNHSDSREQSAVDSTIGIGTGGPSGQLTYTAPLTPNFMVTSTYGYRVMENWTIGTGNMEPAHILSAGTLTGTTYPSLASGSLTVLYDGNRSGGGWYSMGTRNHAEWTTDAYYNKRQWLGQHTFQFGLQWKPATKAFWDNLYTTPYAIYELAVTQADGSYKRVPYRQTTYDPNRQLGFSNTMAVMGGYFMDKWNPTARLSVNMGVRFDRQNSQNVLGASALDVVSTDPRFGLAYRLTRSGRDVIRFAWARQHTLIYNQAAPGYTDSTVSTQTNMYDVTKNASGAWAPAGNMSYPVVTPGYVNAAIPSKFRDTTIHPGHQDLIFVGYTRQLPKKVVLDVAFNRRKISDQLTSLNVNYIFQDKKWMGLVDPAYNTVNVYKNNTWSYQYYNDIEFSAVRNIGGRIQLFSSYTRQWAVQKGTWAPNNVNRYLTDPSWFEDKYCGSGCMTSIRPHLINLNGNYRTPLGFTVAAIMSWKSGVAGGPLIHYLDSADPAVTDPNQLLGVPSVKMTTGTTVNNPLKIAARYVGPASQGQIRTPMVPRLNIRFGKEFRMKESQRLTFSCDFFNISNNGTGLYFSNGSAVDAGPGKPPATPLGTLSATGVQSPRGAQLTVRYQF